MDSFTLPRNFISGRLAKFTVLHRFGKWLHSNRVTEKYSSQSNMLAFTPFEIQPYSDIMLTAQPWRNFKPNRIVSPPRCRDLEVIDIQVSNRSQLISRGGIPIWVLMEHPMDMDSSLGGDSITISLRNPTDRAIMATAAMIGDTGEVITHYLHPLYADQQLVIDTVIYCEQRMIDFANRIETRKTRLAIRYYRRWHDIAMMYRNERHLLSA